MKSKVDKLDVDELVPNPFDLSKLSYIVKVDVVKKGLYILKKKIYMLRSKTLKVKHLICYNLTTNTTLNAQINEAKNKIPSINNLAATAALNAKANEIKS